MFTTPHFVMNRVSVTIKIRQEKVSRSDTSSIFCQAFVNGQKVMMSLGITCPVANWDSRSSKVIYSPDTLLTKDRVQKWNDIITRMVDRANDLRHHYDMINRPLTAEIFKREMRDDSRHQDFYDFVEKYIESVKPRWSTGTIRHHLVTVNKLKEMQPIVGFGDLDRKFVTKFEGFLKSKKLGVNTIWRHHKDLRLFINEAIRSGIRIANPYDDFKIAKAKANRTYLSAEEVITLRDLMLSGKLHPSYDTVLRYFLFCCFTGLRISDVMALTYDDIMDGQLVFIPKKTKRYQKIVKVPLNETARWLAGSGKGKIFDTFAEQVTNRYLKEIASMAGIRKHISFHVSRHTFAMRFLEKGGKVEVLRDLLGHSDITTTMEYVHDMNHMAKEQIMLLDN